MKKDPPSSASLLSASLASLSLDLTDRDAAFIRDVVVAVNQAMDAGHVNVDAIATQLHLTSQSFRRRIRRIVGTSPKAFFTRLQLQRATYLLARYPRVPVLTVAKLCAFENSSSFAHTFRRVLATSPSRFRDEAPL